LTATALHRRKMSSLACARAWLGILHRRRRSRVKGEVHTARPFRRVMADPEEYIREEEDGRRAPILLGASQRRGRGSVIPLTRAARVVRVCSARDVRRLSLPLHTLAPARCAETSGFSSSATVRALVSLSPPRADPFARTRRGRRQEHHYHLPYKRDLRP
jgi:hypothetical protein